MPLQREISGRLQYEAGISSIEAVAPAPIYALYYRVMYDVWNYADPSSPKQEQPSTRLDLVITSHGHVTEVTEMFCC